MANMINAGTFHPRRVNQYVPRMQYSSDVNYNGFTRVDFGLPAAASANNIVNARDLAAAISLDLTGLAQAAEPYGRNLQFTGSSNVAAGSAMTIRGYDYLNQPMSEVVNTVAGATVIQGVRAFKSLTSITFAANAGSPAPPPIVTMSVGFGLKLGLPYRAIDVTTEVANGVPRATVGTLVTGPFAQTTNGAGQADPRGTFQPNTPMNGATRISAHFYFANDISGTPGNVPFNEACGLMGFPHAG